MAHAPIDTSAGGADAERQASLRRSIRRAKLTTFFACAALTLAVCSFAVLQLNQVSVPDSQQRMLERGARHLVDVVLVDEPDVDEQYIHDLVKPMLMVMEHHRPGIPSHLRLLIMRDGFPSNMAADGVGLAAFAKEQDLFVFDSELVLQDRRREGLEDVQAYRAFLMGHEAYHRIQWLNGELENHVSTAEDRQAYAQDLIEMAAFEEGSKVAEALLPPGQSIKLSMQQGYFPGLALTPYSGLSTLDVGEVATVNIATDWTPKGTYRRLLRAIDFSFTSLAPPR